MVADEFRHALLADAADGQGQWPGIDAGTRARSERELVVERDDAAASRLLLRHGSAFGAEPHLGHAIDPYGSKTVLWFVKSSA